MSIFEYDEELHMQQERAAAREDGLEEGRELGLAIGREIGREQLLTVIRLMCEDGLTENIPKLTTDVEFFQSMLSKHNL